VEPRGVQRAARSIDRARARLPSGRGVSF
jgi:hypothetical protein